jgi:acyl-coenzyme A thioesterase PaaI-like protein
MKTFLMNSSRQKKYKRLIRLLNFYPPFFFSGIKVIENNAEFTYFKVRLKLSWYNKNLVGTAFGGSLYAMCDPFFMFILIVNLGDSYIVWDKAASIDFISPGKGRVYGTFAIDQKTISAIKSEVDQVGKMTYTFPCEVVDPQGKLIASLKKTVNVRKKDIKKA